MSSLAASRLAAGQVLRLALASPPRNILDRPALAELRRQVDSVVTDNAANRKLKAILLTAEGPNFSFGASVVEHARSEVAAMLEAFFGTIQALLSPCIPIVCAVNGQCLGGGLELALLATRLFAHSDAMLGAPEIRLGAMAPLASLILPGRIGQARAEDLLLTGRAVRADEALELGLVDELTGAEPEQAALSWLEKRIFPHSASSLRFATRAARTLLLADIAKHLPELQRLYVSELSRTEDAEEGVRAFGEKRPPRWKDQ